jgi:hypothetical protein
MTYNFDPDRWYENEINYLRTMLKTGKITEEDFKERSTKLTKRYEEMWERLDGTYQVAQPKEMN